MIRHIPARYGIPNMPQSPDIGLNSYSGISDFRIFGQSVINNNCYNSRTSCDFDINIGPVTKAEKRNTATLSKLMMMSY